MEQTGQFRHKSIRLTGYDYSQNGAYFVTICARGRMPWLGRLEKDTVRLSPAGEIVRQEWLKTSQLRRDVQVDEFVIMPNHFHAVLIISREDEATHRVASTTLRQGSVGSIVGQFKSSATKRIHRLGNVSFGWQRNFYEHVIRNDFDLNDVRQYIINNPSRWAMDDENPDYHENH